MAKNIGACLSHHTDHWATPKLLYNEYMIKGFIDPCPLHCTNNNLGVLYENKRIFINPPFSKLDEWIDYVLFLVHHNNEIHLLMPSRTDTRYFNRLLNSGFVRKIVFFTGRLHFNDSKNPSPFPSMLVIIQKCILGQSWTTTCCTYKLNDYVNKFNFVYSEKFFIERSLDLYGKTRE